MTMEKLIEELGKSDYVARSINFTKENFSASKDTPKNGNSTKRNAKQSRT